MERVARIEKVCEAHGVKIVEAALRFPLAHPSVLCVIPGAATPAEVALNMKTLAAKIDPSLWSDLKSQGLLRSDAPVPR
jgi:D-threo-aldose 1-dehydrogenase